MSAPIVRKVRAGAPVPDDTAYHAPVADPKPVARKCGADARWLAVLLVLILAGAASFHFFHH